MTGDLIFDEITRPLRNKDATFMDILRREIFWKFTFFASSKNHENLHRAVLDDGRLLLGNWMYENVGCHEERLLEIFVSSTQLNHWQNIIKTLENREVFIWNGPLNNWTCFIFPILARNLHDLDAALTLHVEKFKRG